MQSHAGEPEPTEGLRPTLPHEDGPSEQGPSAGASNGGSPDSDARSDANHPAGGAPAPKKSRARTFVAAAFALIGVLAIVGVTVGYFLFFRYTPLAEHHIPAATNVAVRADVRAIGTFAPVRKHLWPVIYDRPSQKAAGKTFADRLSEGTGINPSLDVREVIVASVDAKSWVVLVGGTFKPGSFVPGLEKVLKDEGYADWHRAGELLVGPGGMAIGQADDGTLVLGTEAEIVTASLPASEEYRRLDLPKDGALGFAVTKEAWAEMSRDAGAFDISGSLRRIRHMRGTLTLGDEPGVDLDIEPKGGENAETLGRDVETFLGALRLGLVLVPDQMGEKTALSSAKVNVENARVHIRGPWPIEGLERGCEKLARLIAR